MSDTPTTVQRPTIIPERPKTPAAPLPATPPQRVLTPPDAALHHLIERS